jgi:hypothetical protein
LRSEADAGHLNQEIPPMHQAIAPIPPNTIQLWRLLTGGMVSRAVYVACKLGLPDACASAPHTATELAEICGGHPDALSRYLRVLAAAGLFHETDDGVFGLTELGELLRRDVPGSMWPFAILTDEMIEPSSAAALLAARTGRSAFEHAHGRGLYEHLAADPDGESLFAAAMSARTERLHDEVIDAVDWEGVHHIIDVGGNHGALLAAVLKRLPAATGVLFDQPQVVAAAGPSLAEAGVADRVDVLGGDFFAAVPPAGDLYLLANVLWNWADDKAERILRRCHDTMASTARLVIVEPVVPPGDEPHLAKTHDLINFWINGGRVRDVTQWRALLAAAGFELHSIVETPLQWSVIEARPSSFVGGKRTP